MRIWAPALSEAQGSGWEPQSADSSGERWRGLEPVLRVGGRREAAACWDTGKEGIWQVGRGGAKSHPTLETLELAQPKVLMPRGELALRVRE